MSQIIISITALIKNQLPFLGKFLN